jgi:hypothetical protein
MKQSQSKEILAPEVEIGVVSIDPRRQTKIAYIAYNSRPLKFF